MSRKQLVIVLIIVLIAISAPIIYRQNLFKHQEEQYLGEGNQSINSVIEYNGKNYRYDSSLTNILFLGVDNNDPIDRITDPAHAGQSDAIFILTLNSDTREARILSINRNSMTEIDIFDNDGQIIYTIDGQVTLQYAYGIGGDYSSRASMTTISEMLFDLPIDGYLVMNISGINTINDLVGGVDVLMPRDYTVIDPQMTEGTSVHISGDMAEDFVRYRNHDEFNSVADRMERQILYVTALLDKLDQQDSSTLYNTLSPYLGDIIFTNLTSDELNNLSNYSYSGCQVDLIPGEMIDTDTFEEYHIDYDELEAFIVNTYYNEC